MRRLIKTHMFVSGLFLIILLGAMAAFFGPAGNFGVGFMNLLKAHIGKAEVVIIPPIKGHWLRTAEDGNYNPPALNLRKPAGRVNPEAMKPVTATVFTLEQAKSALNKTANCLNIMYIWCDVDQLKVISITSFNRTTKQAAIVVIPLTTVTDNGLTVNLNNRYSTLQDLFRDKGREGVRQFLEQKLEIDIPNFVQVNQNALKKLSDIIGELEVSGDKTTMLEAFEQTAAGIRTDDREVVRAVASQVLRPGIILEIPELLYIFTHDILSNFTTQEMVEIFYFSRQMNLKGMKKTALPGFEYYRTPEQKFLFVSEQVWKNIIHDITQSTAL